MRFYRRKEGIFMGLHKILIVDDDTNISNLLRLYLEKENFSTIIAEEIGRAHV